MIMSTMGGEITPSDNEALFTAYQGAITHLGWTAAMGGAFIQPETLGELDAKMRSVGHSFSVVCRARGSAVSGTEDAHQISVRLPARPNDPPEAPARGQAHTLLWARYDVPLASVAIGLDFVEAGALRVCNRQVAAQLSSTVAALKGLKSQHGQQACAYETTATTSHTYRPVDDPHEKGVHAKYFGIVRRLATAVLAADARERILTPADMRPFR